MEPVTVTVQDACKALGLGSTKIYELISLNKLETVKIGRRTLIKVPSIKRLVDIE